MQSILAYTIMVLVHCTTLELAMKSEVIEFNGIKFRRYPDSPHMQHRKYYKPHAGHIKNGVQSLHTEIWKAKYGPIPAGYHVHHKDGDTLNNDLSNLECISAAEHAAKHREERSRYGKSPANQPGLDAAREAAKAWHASPAGKAWHKQHAKEFKFGNPTPQPVVCQHCGKTFRTRAPHRAMYCNYICRQRAYSAAAGTTLRLHDVNCKICGQTFQTTKPRLAKYCGKLCKAKASVKRLGG